MIFASIALPHWVSYSVTTAKGDTLEKHIGLHRSCSTLDDPECRPFPYRELCQEGERYFCSMWKTVGFLASFSVILCLGALVSFVVVMRGGKYKRETGWPFVAAMLSLVSTVEFIIISIVVRTTASIALALYPARESGGSLLLALSRLTCQMLTAAYLGLSVRSR